MNLFFAYVLAVCPALNDVIFWLMLIVGALFLFLITCLIQAEPDTDEYTRIKSALWFLAKCFLVLALLWAFVPSQKRLNAMMLNYHAGCVDVRDEYGVQK